MLNIQDAIIYDIETYPNAFTLDMECLNSDFRATWEISHYRDDRNELLTWFNHLSRTQTPMIGFNNLHFDYPVIHFITQNPRCTVEQIYEKAMHIIKGDDRFANMVWASDRFAPQIDLFKINHFDNRAKSTSLKALQINMRSENVIDLPIEVGTTLTEKQINDVLIPYGRHDVRTTKDFARYNMPAIDFRTSLVEQFGIDVMNWPDTKIGSRMMENRLGENLCYDRSSGRKKPRQTPRQSISLNDIIFDYIKFEEPEFQRVLNYMRDQVLTVDYKGDLQTKGVFSGLHATLEGVDYHFGTGGIHGSVERQKFESMGDYIIRDIDVASLYPSIAIVNGVTPEHLGKAFSSVYAELPRERKKWQKEKGKKCVEANALKLASNGVYGNSNNKYSVFYDPKFTMTITINGQLMLCMLAEKLLKVPTLKVIQINTDGITYYIDKQYEPTAAEYCKNWEKVTALVLEDADYSRMWIRDVNNYIAEGVDGSLKLKGAYWTPDPINYHDSISKAQPPAWHKDLSNVISTRAAVANMVHNVPIEEFLKYSKNPYEFMCRYKAKRSDILLHGDETVQKTCRYYVSRNGQTLKKISPPAGPQGKFKRKNGVTQHQYETVMSEVNWAWDERVCTKNKSVYTQRVTNVQNGFVTTICNDVNDFDFNTVNYDWYLNEAKKLIIC